jgi:hypothetical protein
MDTRINRLGFAIGQRSDHEWAAGQAWKHLGEARFYRGEAALQQRMGNERLAAEHRAYARWHLAQAAKWRRSFADRVTPAPPKPGELLAPGWEWVWQIGAQEWWPLPRGGWPLAPIDGPQYAMGRLR